jgi:hypothetical protein
MSVITTSLASGFLIVAIAALNSRHTISQRLGMMTFFTAGFSFFVGLFAPQRRVKVFSAPAAFAAVQVVFIGGNNSTMAS